MLEEEEVKKAFYAGFQGMLNFIGKNITNAPGGPSKKDLDKLEDLYAELNEFVHGVQ